MRARDDGALGLPRPDLRPGSELERPCAPPAGESAVRVVQTLFRALNCTLTRRRFVDLQGGVSGSGDSTGERHFPETMYEFVEYYHRERNHQGLDNELIDVPRLPGAMVGFAVVSVSAGCSTTIAARRDGSVNRLGPSSGTLPARRAGSAASTHWWRSQLRLSDGIVPKTTSGRPTDCSDSTRFSPASITSTGLTLSRRDFMRSAASQTVSAGRSVVTATRRMR